MFFLLAIRLDCWRVPTRHHSVIHLGEQASFFCIFGILQDISAAEIQIDTLATMATDLEYDWEDEHANVQYEAWWRAIENIITTVVIHYESNHKVYIDCSWARRNCTVCYFLCYLQPINAWQREKQPEIIYDDVGSVAFHCRNWMMNSIWGRFLLQLLKINICIHSTSNIFSFDIIDKSKLISYQDYLSS